MVSDIVSAVVRGWWRSKACFQKETSLHILLHQSTLLKLMESTN